jgi:hypothetical protein
MIEDAHDHVAAGTPEEPLYPYLGQEGTIQQMCRRPEERNPAYAVTRPDEEHLLITVES